MKLLEQCKLANEKLAELADAEQANGVAENIRKRSNELAEASESLVDVSTSASLLLKEGILNESQLLDDAKPRSYVADIRQKLSEDPSAITSGRTFTNLKKSVQKHSEKTVELVNESWSSHVAEIAPKVDSKLLSQHRNTSFSDVVVKLERTAKEAKKIAKNAPTGSDAFNALKEIWSVIRNDLASLPQADNPEVQAFLIAVGSETGADLSLITDSVRDWLVGNQMIEDFSVRRRK